MRVLSSSQTLCKKANKHLSKNIVLFVKKGLRAHRRYRVEALLKLLKAPVFYCLAVNLTVLQRESCSRVQRSAILLSRIGSLLPL